MSGFVRRDGRQNIVSARPPSTSPATERTTGGVRDRYQTHMPVDPERRRRIGQHCLVNNISDAQPFDFKCNVPSAIV